MLKGTESIAAEAAPTESIGSLPLETPDLVSIVSALRTVANVLRWFDTEVKTTSGKIIAIVRKQPYVRLKPKVR